ncbi:sensor histidine kinase [Cutibacterium sp.]|uniref:sensor histidine kinase n=1 Tax=Cutibacterium sp. TaxID=1912221 RepID=UPI0026DCABEC|nr:sensor histidine kinase [Cutibacterium sp.]MDO4412600.1 sensor histidine kinase [Cutibacterium sp.]
MEETGSQTSTTDNRSAESRGSGMRARLNRLNPARNNVPQITIPGMEEVLDPKLDDGRPADTERAWWGDVTLTLVMAVVTIVPYFVSVVERPFPEYAAALISSVIMVASLPIRRDQPLLMMVLVALGATIQFTFVPFPVLSIFIVPIASYSVARWVDGPESRWVLWIGALGSVIGPVRWQPTITIGYDPTSGTPWVLLILAMTVCAGLVLTPYAVGRRLRESALIESQQRIVKAQRYRAILAEREQQARVAEERTRNEIARELHDIVAHSLSVMIVQAEGGKALATKKPEKAPEVLDTIAETGREALVEMRRIVGVLRQDADAEYSPSPGLAEIPELVEKSGVKAELRVTGDEPVVSQALGLVIYRVVQEALTNVLKHAGPSARATVTLAYSPTAIYVEILDNGYGAAVQGDGRGHGLQGMRERVTSMGGQLSAGPRKESGFCVRAKLPVQSDSRQR